VHVYDIFNGRMLANGSLMQAYIESLIWFSLTRTKLLDIPKPVPVHLWLDHTVTVHHDYSKVKVNVDVYSASMWTQL